MRKLSKIFLFQTEKSPIWVIDTHVFMS
jgi:hypothetical protein